MYRYGEKVVLELEADATRTAGSHDEREVSAILDSIILDN